MQCKSQNYELLDDNIGNNLGGFGDNFDTTTKACSMEEKMEM